MPRALVLRHKSKPDLYIHYDPRHGRYILAKGGNGACSFTDENARAFMAVMTPERSADMEITMLDASRLVDVGHGCGTPLPPPQGEAARMYRELYETESYQQQVCNATPSRARTRDPVNARCRAGRRRGTTTRQTGSSSEETDAEGQAREEGCALLNAHGRS